MEFLKKIRKIKYVFLTIIMEKTYCYKRDIY